MLLLNNDTEVISRKWLGAMVEHIQREEVAVVGAKLLYANGTVQHARVLLEVVGIAGRHSGSCHSGSRRNRAIAISGN